MDKNIIQHLANIAAVNNYISSIANSAVRTSFSGEQIKKLNKMAKVLDKEFIDTLIGLENIPVAEQTKRVYTELEQKSLANTLNDPKPIVDKGGAVIMTPVEEKPQPKLAIQRPRAIKGPGGEIVMEPVDQPEANVEKKPGRKGIKRINDK